jgi:hypothetical protein
LKARPFFDCPLTLLPGWALKPYLHNQSLFSRILSRSGQFRFSIDHLGVTGYPIHQPIASGQRTTYFRTIIFGLSALRSPPKAQTSASGDERLLRSYAGSQLVKRLPCGGPAPKAGGPLGPSFYCSLRMVRDQRLDKVLPLPNTTPSDSLLRSVRKFSPNYQTTKYTQCIKHVYSATVALLVCALGHRRPCTLDLRSITQRIRYCVPFVVLRGVSVDWLLLLLLVLLPGSTGILLPFRPPSIVD